MGPTAATRSPAESRLPADDPDLFTLDLRGLRQRWAERAAMPAIGAEAMRGADHRARAMGVAEERLMEHAGTAVAAAARSSSSAGPATTVATATWPHDASRSTVAASWLP
jgi:hypothetical protein